MPCRNVILHSHKHILSCQIGAYPCLKHLMSFLFAELLCCKAIMFCPKKVLASQKDLMSCHFAMLLCLKTVLSCLYVVLRFLVFPLCYNYVENTFVDMKINSIDYKCRL